MFITWVMAMLGVFVTYVFLIWYDMFYQAMLTLTFSAILMLSFAVYFVVGV